MDPNQCLEQIRAAVNGILDDGPASLWTMDLDEPAVRLALVTVLMDIRDLDRWLSAGGFSPTAWQTSYTGRPVKRAEP